MRRPIAIAIALAVASISVQARYPGTVYAECNGPDRSGCQVAPVQPIPAELLDRIRAKVRGNIVVPPGVQGNPEAVFIVDQLPDGTVVNVRLVQSSGNPALDVALERAIRRSSPLPLAENQRLFERTLTLRLGAL